MKSIFILVISLDTGLESIRALGNLEDHFIQNLKSFYDTVWGWFSWREDV